MKKRTNRAKGTLLVAFLLFAVIVGGLVFRKYDTATRVVEPARQSVPAVPAPPAGTAVVTLFFAAEDGSGLVREGREVEIEERVEEGIARLVAELASGPVGSHSPTLPPNTRVLGVRLEGEVALVDLGAEFKEGIPSGSSAEMAAVYSVVDTVAANFPQVKGVRFLIEGAPVAELGHLDLSAPLAPDYSLEKKEALGKN